LNNQYLEYIHEKPTFNYTLCTFQHFLKILSNPSADGNETQLAQRVIRLRPSSAAAADRLDLSKQMESVREPFSGNHFHTLTMYDQNDRTVRELTKVWTQACRGAGATGFSHSF
jgi:hypothetical protein